MNLKNHIQLIVLIFLFNHSILSAQEKIDSSQISIYFEKLSGSPDSLISSITSFKSKIPKKELDQFYYQYSKYLLQNGQIEQAGKQAKDGILLFKKNTTNTKIVKLYNILAASFSLKKEYVGAIQLFNKSIAIAEKKNNKKQCAYLQNNIANIFFSLQDYPSAYNYSLRSFTNIKEFQNDPYHNQILSVLSVAEAKIGKIKQAEIHADQALKEALSKNDVHAIIIAQYALGDIALSKNEYAQAKTYFLNSLELSESIHDYNFAMLNCTGLLTTCVELKDFSSAIAYGEKSITISHALQNDNIQYSVYRHLARAYAGNGENAEAYKYLLAAHNIYKESSNSENQKTINTILIKYDTEKKEKELARKNIQLLEQDAKVSRFFLITLSLIILLIFFSFYYFFQRSKAKQLAEKTALKNERKTLDALIQGEEIERLRISNELHDGLASSLTAVRFKLESMTTENVVDQNELIAMLRSTHEDTRRIAHNLSPLLIEQHGLSEALKIYCSENSSKFTSVNAQVTGNLSLLSKEYSTICYRFIQELVQNALKHAQASSININMFYLQSGIRIMVEDNGIGFEFQFDQLKGGLLSLHKRIENLKGNLEIDSTPKNGTVIIIEIPLA